MLPNAGDGGNSCAPAAATAAPKDLALPDVSHLVVGVLGGTECARTGSWCIHNAQHGLSVRWIVLCPSQFSTSVHRYSTSWPTLMNIASGPR